MKECLVIGGGIEALITAFTIKKYITGINITIKTKNSDPRQGNMGTADGATWSGLSPRHITCFEGYNRNVLKLNGLVLQKRVSAGGWLGKKDFSKKERDWLARRMIAQHFEDFNLKLLNFYQEYNSAAIEIWHDLINSYGNLFYNTRIKYGVQKLYCNPSLVQTKRDGFSLLIHKLAINILNHLEGLGVCLQFDTQVTFPQDYKNIIIAVGAYDCALLQNTSVANRIFAVAGSWLTATINGFSDNFQLRTNDIWQQNYTLLNNNTYLVGGGYAMVGFNVNSLCDQDRKALVKRNIELANKFSNNIRPLDKLCFRSFTDNDVPIISVEQNCMGGKTIIVAGMNTGTTTAAPLTGQIVANILQDKDDAWLKRLNIFNHEWNKLSDCNKGVI